MRRRVQKESSKLKVETLNGGKNRSITGAKLHTTIPISSSTCFLFHSLFSLHLSLSLSFSIPLSSFFANVFRHPIRCLLRLLWRRIHVLAAKRFFPGTDKSKLSFSSRLFLVPNFPFRAVITFFLWDFSNNGLLCPFFAYSRGASSL